MSTPRDESLSRPPCLPEPDPIDVGDFEDGIWLPRMEDHLRDWMRSSKRARRVEGRLTYQFHKQLALREALDRVDPEWRSGTFVDVGAHCGLWSMWWARWAAHVLAVEPVPDFRALFRANLTPMANYTLVPCALSDRPGALQMRVIEFNSGATRVLGAGETPPEDVLTVDALTLDVVIEEHLPDESRVVALKLDCEGYEEKVVRGAEAMLAAHRPMVVVEQKFEKRTYGFEERGAVKALEKMGYVVEREMSGDFIMRST